MKKMYTYEFELFHGEKQWIIQPFDLPGITQGVDLEDVYESAEDLLKIVIEDYLMKGIEPPEPTFSNEPRNGGEIVVISVEASLDDVERVPASKAAELLGVTAEKVTAMVKSGLLEGWKEGRNSWITLDSVNARLASARKSGRPLKNVA